jgi:hypothetical protein
MKGLPLWLIEVKRLTSTIGRLSWHLTEHSTLDGVVRISPQLALGQLLLGRTLERLQNLSVVLMPVRELALDLGERLLSTDLVDRSHDLWQNLAQHSPNRLLYRLVWILLLSLLLRWNVRLRLLPLRLSPTWLWLALELWLKALLLLLRFPTQPLSRSLLLLTLTTQEVISHDLVVLQRLPNRPAPKLLRPLRITVRH